MDFLKAILTNELTIPLIFFCLAILFIVFLIVQSNRNKKSRDLLLKDLYKTQEKLFTNAAELLSSKLAEYTDSVLIDKVNANYVTLVSEDLLPSVNDAARIIAELSETVVIRQEEGMKELAEHLSELLASKTRDYIHDEAIVINSLQETTTAFSDKLTGISAIIEQMSLRFSNVYEQANTISLTISDAAVRLGDKMEELGVMLQNTTQSVGKMQEYILESGKIVDNLSEAASGIQKNANDASIMLSSQNERTAELLNNAVHSMQQNTEFAAKSVLSEFNTTLGTATTSIENAVTTLHEISADIRNSATQFSEGIMGTYGRFGSEVNENLALVSKSISASAENEYQKIMISAENYSNNFARGLENFNNSFEVHIANLQTITQQLNNNVNSFANDVDVSSSRFELGMEKSVSAALKEMDSALAEIVKRLVTVTANIQDAADALPRAVKSIKELN